MCELSVLYGFIDLILINVPNIHGEVRYSLEILHSSAGQGSLKSEDGRALAEVVFAFFKPRSVH